MENRDHSIFLQDGWRAIKEWHLIDDNIQSLDLLLLQFALGTYQFI